MTPITWGLLAAIVAGFAALGFFARCKLARLHGAVENTFLSIDAALRLRQDQLPALVNACRAFMTYGRDELDHLLLLHASLSQVPALKVRITFENELSRFLCQVQSSFGDYPELQRNELIGTIRSKILEHELEIMAHRPSLNEAIRRYNSLTRSFPLAPVAAVCGYPRLPELEATEPELADAELSASASAVPAMTE